MSSERSPQTYTRKEMVHGTLGDNSTGWNFTFWVHFHRDVLHFHFVLGLQDLLCLRIDVTRSSNDAYRSDVCDDSGIVFPA